MDFNHIIQCECVQHRIESIEYVQTKYISGKAYGNRTISMTDINILKADDIYFGMGVFFHELGHFVHNHFEKANKFSYVEEYEATMYAIQKMKEYEFPFEEFELKMKCYVIKKIAQAFNKKHDIKKIPKNIKDWVEFNESIWVDAKRIYMYEPDGITSLNELEYTIHTINGDKFKVKNTGYEQR